MRIKAGLEALESRLMRHGAIRKSELCADLALLVRRPLGDRQHQLQFRQDGRYDHGHDGRQHVAPALGATRIGDDGKRGQQTDRIDSLHAALLVSAPGGEIPLA